MNHKLYHFLNNNISYSNDSNKKTDFHITYKFKIQKLPSKPCSVSILVPIYIHKFRNQFQKNFIVSDQAVKAKRYANELRISRSRFFSFLSYLLTISN